jgi:hypothetical protein
MLFDFHFHKKPVYYFQDKENNKKPYPMAQRAVNYFLVTLKGFDNRQKLHHFGEIEACIIDFSTVAKDHETFYKNELVRTYERAFPEEKNKKVLFINRTEIDCDYEEEILHYLLNLFSEFHQIDEIVGIGEEIGDILEIFDFKKYEITEHVHLYILDAREKNAPIDGFYDFLINEKLIEQMLYSYVIDTVSGKIKHLDKWRCMEDYPMEFAKSKQLFRYIK